MRTDEPLLGARGLDPAVDVGATVDRVSVDVPTSVTENVISTVPQHFGGSVNDGLLAALAIAVTAWRRSRGQRSGDVLVNLEGHGREENAVPGADLSRTVGGSPTLFPVRIDLTGLDVVDALAGGSTAASAVKLVKETLLGLPDNGIGFGILKYLDRNEELRELPTPQISFNYLGRFAGSDPEHGEVPWLPISEVTLDEAHSGELAAAFGTRHQCRHDRYRTRSDSARYVVLPPRHSQRGRSHRTGGALGPSTGRTE